MASTLKNLMRVSLSSGGAAFEMATGCSQGVRSRAAPNLMMRQFTAQAGKGSNKGRQQPPPPGPRLMQSNTAVYALAGAVGVAGAYYLWSQGGRGDGDGDSSSGVSGGSDIDYEKVYKAISKVLDEDPDYDDGSYGPIFLRLAWHASGTYDQKSCTGGSNKGTMRFDPEASHDANAGLHVARQKLEKIKKQFPEISYGDLWTLAGVVAVQEMGGPVIPWKPGRVDGTAKDCPPDGRLPDGSNPTFQHPRDIFYRMGFNDQEITALLGAHTLGRCHTDRSGFDGPWSFSPTTFTNSFYIELLNRNWVDRKWSGPKQFEDKESQKLMMLPADMVFANDKSFRKWAEVYAKDEKKFFEDFAKAYKKLLELGVPFKEGTREYKFKTTS